MTHAVILFQVVNFNSFELELIFLNNEAIIVCSTSLVLRLYPRTQTNYIAIGLSTRVKPGNEARALLWEHYAYVCSKSYIPCDKEMVNVAV